MVRVKDKKAKGDEAFTTRKQKVGRKKLAPVTATQADVHARTLRISTSSSLAAAAGLRGAGKSVIPSSTATAAHDAITPGSKRPRDHGDKEVDIGLTTITAHSFSELLAGTQHYKASQRASAFASMAKLLSLQAHKEANAAAARGGDGLRTSDYVVLPSSTTAMGGAGAAAAPTTAAVLEGVNPLEKIKCFSAALEAMTDTDDQVRRAALHGLRTLLGQPDFFAATTALVQEDEDASSLFVDAREAEEDGEDCVDGAAVRASMTQLDHVMAVLQAIHVGLTHAMKPVRLSAVELLGLLLRTAPASAVRAAARAVCAQQQAYLHSSTAPLIGVMGMGTSGATASTTSVVATTSVVRPGTQDAAQIEEEWMLTLVRRVSALVLRTEHLSVLADLLDTFLCPQQLLTAMVSSSGAEASAGASRDRAWQHPELVKALFDEVLPKWSTLWKELMELKLQLLRHDSKLLMAAALAQCFATVLVFLKAQHALVVRRQHEQSSARGASSARTGPHALFSRQMVQSVREILIQRIPVTLAEVLRQDQTDDDDTTTTTPYAHGGDDAPKKRATSSTAKGLASTLLPETIGGAGKRGGRRVSANKADPRLQLALALARVSVPLAGTDDGWKLLHHFLSVVFSYESHQRPSGTDGTSREKKAPFHFHTSRDVLSCLQTFHLALQLYPSALSGTGAATAAAAAAAGGEESSLSPQAYQQQAVLRKLIPFVPAVLQTITRELARFVRPLHAGHHARTAAADQLAVEDAVVLRQLALVADMMRVVTTFPLHCPISEPASGAVPACGPYSSATVAAAAVTEGQKLSSHEKSASSAPSSVSASTAKANEVLRLSVEQACLWLPRLLFGLRWQRKETLTTVSQAARESTGTASAQSGPVTHTHVQRVGVLPHSTAALDRIVRRLLRCVWFVASSGHPLLLLSPTPAASACSRTSSSSSSSSSFASQWRTSLMALYGLCKPDQDGTGAVVVAEGVLARCTASTAGVARDALIYLGVRDTEKLTIHHLDWSNSSTHEWSTAVTSATATASSYSIEDILAMLPA